MVTSFPSKSRSWVGWEPPTSSNVPPAPSDAPPFVDSGIFILLLAAFLFIISAIIFLVTFIGTIGGGSNLTSSVSIGNPSVLLISRSINCDFNRPNPPGFRISDKSMPLVNPSKSGMLRSAVRSCTAPDGRSFAISASFSATSASPDVGCLNIMSWVEESYHAARWGVHGFEDDLEGLSYRGKLDGTENPLLAECGHTVVASGKNQVFGGKSYFVKNFKNYRLV
ncbi:hypothetical protein GCK72_016879 [Caenorhabditis remanei]|uniref:Uncharacterized protein n=1 Tax=Caenorhabditis remanei TaxID=31234 RepID=A0A6A5G5T2_CAERE|nr:hypothetical protein GCK72_016879 [Caenorhabditis remanei]KAF1750330.1 hypothetical protein GCK72_016879 [Caenorhabditis remanei]